MLKAGAVMQGARPGGMTLGSTAGRGFSGVSGSFGFLLLGLNR